MKMVKVKAKVVYNNGKTALLKPDDGKGLTTKMYRGEESRQEFLAMFPPGQEVELDRLEVPPSLMPEFDRIAQKGGWQELEQVEALLRRAVN
jgi:hypothetical protein